MTKRSGSQFIFLCIATILIDQLTKHLASTTQLNTGISFGFFSGPILTIALIAVLLLIALKFGQAFFHISPLATGIFFGASLSNIVDRLMYGGVRDFLFVPLFDIRNNLADWGIILSLLWILLHSKQPSFTKTSSSS